MPCGRRRRRVLTERQRRPRWARSPGRRRRPAGGSPTSSGGRCRRWSSTTNRSAVSASTSSARRRHGRRSAVALVTPIGADGLGVTTAAAVEGRAGEIEAMLPSGAVVSAELLGADNGVAVVQLADAAERRRPRSSEAADGSGRSSPSATSSTVGEEGDDLMSLAVPEAAPIFDADGDLVGLCTIGPNGVEMLRGDVAPRLSRRSPVDRVVRHQRRPLPPASRRTAAARRPATTELDRSTSVDGARVDDRQLVAARSPTVRRSATSEPSATSTPPSSDVADHLTRSGDGSVSATAAAAPRSEAEQCRDGDDHGAADHAAEGDLLAALRRDHRPPPALGALDVGLLVGHRRLSSPAASGGRWRRPTGAGCSCAGRAGSGRVGTASAGRRRPRRRGRAASAVGARR